MSALVDTKSHCVRSPPAFDGIYKPAELMAKGPHTRIKEWASAQPRWPRCRDRPLPPKLSVVPRYPQLEQDEPAMSSFLVK